MKIGRPFTSVGFSVDGSTAVLTSAEDKRVWSWDLSQAAVAGPAAAAGAQAALMPLLNFNQLGGEVCDVGLNKHATGAKVAPCAA